MRSFDDAQIVVGTEGRRISKRVLTEITAPERKTAAHRNRQVFGLIGVGVDADILRAKNSSAWLQGSYAISRHPERIHDIRTEQIGVTDC